MQKVCCLRSTPAAGPGEQSRSEFTARPQRRTDKGTHARHEQGIRQDKPHRGPTRKLSTATQSQKKPPRAIRLPGAQVRQPAPKRQTTDTRSQIRRHRLAKRTTQAPSIKLLKNDEAHRSSQRLKNTKPYTPINFIASSRVATVAYF